jgi:leucyl aminopeptidase
MAIRTIISTKTALQAPVEIMVVPVWEKKKVAAALPARVTRELQTLMRERDWSGAWGTAAFFVAPKVMKAPFVALIGLGGPSASSDKIAEAVRRGVGEVVLDARRHGVPDIGIILHGVANDVALGLAAVEGMNMASYSFTEFSERLVKRAKRQALRSCTLFIDAPGVPALQKALPATAAGLAGTALARTLVNRPAGHMSPKALVLEAQRLAEHRDISLKVFNRAEAEQAGFTAFLAVAKGSTEEPYVIHLTYTPRRAGGKKIFIVGKGVTFDSGGLSLKPAEYMEVHGVICACENMPSGNAYRPGDIVRAMNGKTIEVLNTDAEGRITLADALTYATRHEPDAIIDIATLTGACVVALGETMAGLWGTNEELLADLQAAGASSGEGSAVLPMPEEYQSSIESRVADLRNITRSRFGGAITAAMFLREFTAGIPWAHYDMAGPSYFSHPYISYWGLGASGWGVRTLVRYLTKI